MTGDDRAARIRDITAVYRTALDHDHLPVPTTSPDQAKFLFTNPPRPEYARASIAMARIIFASAFGVTFTWHDEWHPDGTSRQYRAVLPSGLEVVLVAKAAHMPKDEDGAEVRELAEMAA